MTNKQTIAFIEIDDVSLAAALFTMGFTPVESSPYVKYTQPSGQVKYKFFINAEQGLQEYITAWRTPDWEMKPENIDKPFAYIMSFFKNRNGLLDIVKQSTGNIIINKDGKTALISNNANEELQEQIFRKL